MKYNLAFTRVMRVEQINSYDKRDNHVERKQLCLAHQHGQFWQNELLPCMPTGIPASASGASAASC